MKKFAALLIFLLLAATSAQAQFTDQRTFAGTAGGSANAQTLTVANMPALLQGVPIRFYPTAANTGAATVNVNSIGAKNIFKGAVGGPVALTGGELQPSVYATITWDGTEFQLGNAISNLPRSYIAGLMPTYTSATVMGTGAGQAIDSTNTTTISLPAWTKSTAGTFVAGSGSNGMGAGLTIANSTWYDVCAAIINGAPDIFFDTGVSGQTPCNQHPPTGTSAYRRAGSFLTNSSAQIIQFFTEDDSVFWTTGVIDVAVTNLGTSATLYALSVPAGVKVRPIVRAIEQATSFAVILTSPDETDQAPNTTTGGAPVYDLWFQGVGTSDYAAPYFLYTNTAQQIRARSAGSPTTFTVFTRGYTDSRGKYN